MSHKRVPVVPNLTSMEFSSALTALALAGLVSVLFDAPVADPADINSVTTIDVKAPWMFLGIQRMLRTMDPFVAGVCIPVGFFCVLAGIPFVRSKVLPWFLSATLLIAYLSLITLEYASW